MHVTSGESVRRRIVPAPPGVGFRPPIGDVPGRLCERYSPPSPTERLQEGTLLVDLFRQPGPKVGDLRVHGDAEHPTYPIVGEAFDHLVGQPLRLEKEDV